MMLTSISSFDLTILWFEVATLIMMMMVLMVMMMVTAVELG